MITPSKKVKYVIAFAIIGVSSIIGLSLIWESNNSGKNGGGLVTAEIDPNIKRETVADNSDKDGDGLLKWQESLWQTSDNDPDTDKDGTPDGQEVLEGRDPTNGSPNDRINIPTSATEDEYEPSETDPNSLTSRVAQTVLANYAKFSSQGNFSDADSSNLAAQIASEASKEARYTARYSISDLKIISRPTSSDIRYFANEMIETIFDGLELIGYDPSAYDDLSVSARSFANTAQRLAEIPVPIEISPVFTQIINNLDGVGYALDSIHNYNSDPARALLALSDYAKISESHAQLFVLIQSYLKTNGILFSANEPAAIGFPELLAKSVDGQE